MIANSKNQNLAQHLLAVARLSQKIQSSLKLDPFFLENKEEVLFLSGLFHDLGKVDPNFQKYIKSKTDEILEDGYHQDAKILEKRATHNELSWAILNVSKIEIFGKDFKNIDKMGYVKYAVYWHHKKLLREVDLLTDGDILTSIFADWDLLNFNLNTIVEELNIEYAKQFNKELGLKITLPDKNDRFKTQIPDFKETSRDFSEYNSRSTFVRSILISADRYISQKDGSGLSLCFENKYLYKVEEGYFNEDKNKDIWKHISTGVEDKNKFPQSERNISQENTAEFLSGKIFSVLAGPPGCGKTRIALLKSAKEKARKIFWICPRLSVCESVFNELYRDYVPDLNVEIFTGDSKNLKKGNQELIETPIEEELSGDIVVTTIDQLLSIMTKNGKNQNLPKILDSHFIFDEFHEILQIPQMIYLLKELLFLMENVGSNVLLMSATPNPNFLKKIKPNFIESRDLHKAWDFHNENILISIKDENHERLEGSSIIDIYNVVSHAQEDYLKDSPKSLLFHSSFTKEDKKQIFQHLMLCFGKNRSFESNSFNYDFNNLRAGPIVQASLNISAQKVRTDSCSQDNLCQRLGRCDRFGNGGGEFEIFDKKDQSSKTYLSRVEFSTNITKAFIEFLKTKGFKTPKSVKRQDFMDIYYSFNSSQKGIDAFDKDWIRTEEYAIDFLRGFEEFKVLKKSKNKIISSSFRGDSIFIYPLVLNEDKYLYDLNQDKIDLNKTLTLSTNSLELTEIINMYKSFSTSQWAKKKYDMNFSKYSATESNLKRLARDPQSPIFSSYINEDCLNANVKNSENSLVYVPFSKSKKYFGLTKISKINKKEKI